MDEYPNADEEFELMYGDELELLREQDDINIEPKKSRKSLNFTPNTQETIQQQESDRITQQQQQTQNDSFEVDFPTISDDFNGDFTQIRNSDNNRKRPRIDYLFGDITDIIDDIDNNDNHFIGNQSKKQKCDKRTADLQLIDHILELRKLNKIKNNPVLTNKDYILNNNNSNDYNCNLSTTIPKYPFIGITRLDGERIYVRFHSEIYEKDEIQRICNGIYTSQNIMGGHFKTIWEDAKILINRSLDKNLENVEIIGNSRNPNDNNNNTQLWVELYKPKRYMELLSDESTNRTLLRWLKLWDKIVFNRPIRMKKPKTNNFKRSFNNNKQTEFDMELDENGRPKFKVALLCGPPGLGKTTLAHVVARHAGYNIVEINASDDRNIDNFKTILEHSTQMRSILDKENRPNCVIFDEIDGAPQTSIDYLVKFINGTNLTTTKSKKKSSTTKKQQLLKRPIICICNDVYVPTLRNLRQIAFVINFPQTLTNRLAERLLEIANYQNIQTDYASMLTLAEKSNNDIRSCLSILHFYKIENKPITIHEIYKTTIGQKDIRKNLFTVWNEIFFIDRSSIKKQFFNNNNNDNDCCTITLKIRMENILNVVNNFGDYERLMQGIYENYPNMNITDTNLMNTSTSLEWFCWMDNLNRQIYTNQDYSLLNYQQYSFVVWHFSFASTTWQKLQYPNLGYEMKLKETRQKAIITELMHGIQSTTIRPYIQPISLILDILPLISIIIVPKLRPVNLHLYTKQERDDLDRVVNIMIDYNLNYLQERTIDGAYIYKLDPNIEEIVNFTKEHLNRQKHLSYANKQMISREIELMKMKKFEQRLPDENLPNHLQRLQAKSVCPVKKTETSPKSRDFFGRIIVKSPPKGVGKSGIDLKNDIWYQYKEGYSNAVRRKIKISGLK